MSITQCLATSPVQQYTSRTLDLIDVQHVAGSPRTKALPLDTPCLSSPDFGLPPSSSTRDQCPASGKLPLTSVLSYVHAVLVKLTVTGRFQGFYSCRLSTALWQE